jgi:hypothetical protein
MLVSSGQNVLSDVIILPQVLQLVLRLLLPFSWLLLLLLFVRQLLSGFFLPAFDVQQHDAALALPYGEPSL